MIIGIDEAGRGSLLGPLVICAAISEAKCEVRLKKMGARDSKLLSPQRREKLAKEMEKICKFHLTKITAKELNKLMKARISLNQIEANAVSRMLAQIEKEVEIEKIYIDSPDPNPKKFVERLKISENLRQKVHAARCADVIFPIVSAASIVAKVTRDGEIEKIKKELGYDFASGYPHDEITVEFVRKNIKNPSVLKYLRSEWRTTKQILKGAKFGIKQLKLELE